MSKEIKNFTDQELLNLYKIKGDKKSISVLFERYYHLILGVGIKYLKDKDAAADIVMQVFEKILTDVNKHEITFFKSWLYRVAQNQCLMELRKNNQITKSIQDSYVLNMEFQTETHHIEEKETNLLKMENCMEKLQQEQQQCIDLFYLKKMSYADIGNETKFTFMQVKSYIQNGKRQLKICMGEN